jgi:hypothetical protein
MLRHLSPFLRTGQEEMKASNVKEDKYYQKLLQGPKQNP